MSKEPAAREDVSSVQPQGDEAKASALPVQPYRPNMPDWGAFLRWPMDGVQWLHADDVDIAKRLLPSQRVFCRRKWDGEFYWLHYGQEVLRVRPAMWTQVPGVDLEVGQRVELLARLGKNDPGVFRIAEVLFDAAMGRVHFMLSRDVLTMERRFVREDLRPVAIKHHLRVGYYKHQPPSLDASAVSDSLDVGDLLGGE